jgi:hypothetical protein
VYRELPDPRGVALCELYLGLVAVDAEHMSEAGELLGRALRFFGEIGFLQYTAQCLEGAAAVCGQPDEAARLLGAASALRDRTGNPPVGPRARERALATARAELGESGFASAWAEGRALTEGEAVERAQRALAG